MKAEIMKLLFCKRVYTKRLLGSVLIWDWDNWYFTDSDNSA